MSFRIPRTLPAVLAAAVMGTSVLAADPNADVAQQIKELNAKVAQLEAQQKAADNAALTAASADAQQRSQLMQVSGPDYSWGYDKGLFFQSADKAFTLKPGALIQVRNVTNWREDAKNGGASDDFQNGFEIRRLKLFATGNIYTPDLTYGFQLTNNRNTSGIELDDVYVQWRFKKNMAVKFGQYKGPFNREELIGDGGQMAVDRSLLNEVLGGGQTGPRSQGISLVGSFGEDLTKDALRYEVMFNDGDGTPNTDFRDTSGSPDTRPNWGVIGRIDYKKSGNWADYGKFTAKSNKEQLLVYGGGVSISGNEGNTNIRGTVDALWQSKSSKLSVFTALIASHTDVRNVAPGAEDSRLDYGGLAQVSYLVAPQWEPFARANVVKLDEDFITGAVGDEWYPEITIGINRYFGKDGSHINRAKFVIDATYLPSGTPGGDRTGIGELSSGGRNEIVVRAQLQFQL